MKIGFIGAGRAGCSLGKYFSGKAERAGISVTGYSSIVEEEARWAAAFTESQYFTEPAEVIDASDAIIFSTPDGAIKDVWEAIDKERIRGKMICHLSGSLSSDVFSRVEEYGAYPISIHPMFAFSDKESVYQQLHKVSFTLEGHPYAVKCWGELLNATGNGFVEIKKEVKARYHAAASILSNHVIAVLETGYQQLRECGFSEKEARVFSQVLVQDNVNHVIEQGSVLSLTGPIERCDVETVQKHMAVLDEESRMLYQICGRKLIEIAKQKHPKQDYAALEILLNTPLG